MKKTILLILLCLSYAISIAQPGHPHHNKAHSVPPTASLTLTSFHHNESFMVYVDGNLLSPKILSDVTIPNLSLGPHDIYVVLKYPADKITMMHYDAHTLTETFFVSYDVVHNHLELIPQHANTPAIPQPQGVHICTFDEVEHIYQQICKESFDDGRLSVAKSLVTNKHLGSHQIKRLTQAFKFDDTKVQFLKYAYSYCIDPNNYADCLEELSFDSDRKRVREFLGF